LLLQDGEFLKFLREICDAHKSLLIFDEVISGFRVGFEGAAGLYDIRPDIITFGKIIGGGMPVGAYGGKKEIMNMVAPQGPVYQAGTLSGNPVAMAAGIAQLRECLKPGFYNTLQNRTEKLVSEVSAYAQQIGLPFHMFSCGSIFWVSFSEQKSIRRSDEIDPSGMSSFAVFHHELLERGIYLGPSGYEVGFVSMAHEDDMIDFAIKGMCEALSVVKNAAVR
jgi:glutamate-1-semialdehyde 2,1-aminomutase